MGHVYLDHNASTPLDERVLEAMLPFLSGRGGNPSSRHAPGRRARAAVDQAREQVAASVGASAGQVIFTSGGTEANNLAIKGVALGLAPGRIAVSAVEHPSVRGAAFRMRRFGWEVDQIPVDGAGRVGLERLRSALGPQSRLVSVMMANNETGVVQDIAAIAGEARARGLFMHTDTVQAMGKLPVHFAASQVHAMSLSAHKINGPQGVGALVIDRSADLTAILDGGGQERGLRAGTENTAGIVGFGVAAELAAAELERRSTAAARLREVLEARLGALPGLVWLGADAQRLPNTVMFAVPGIDGEALLMALDRAGFAVSSGSACSSHHQGASHVLTAMGVAPELAQASVRVSLGQGNTEAEVHAFADALYRETGRLHSLAASGWA